MRGYDPRVGRFWSTDPLTRSYPWYTPYQFAGNMPIWAIDLDGLEEMKKNSVFHIMKDMNGNLITNPTAVNTTSRYLNALNGVKNINGKTIEVTPGFADKTFGDNNTFLWQQVEGDRFTVKAFNTPVGQDVMGKKEEIVPPVTNNLVQTNDINGDEVKGRTNNPILHTTPPPHPHPPVITQMNYNVQGGVLAYMGTQDIVGGNTKNGTVDLSFPGGRTIKSLLNNITKDGGIKTVNITLRVSVFNTDDAGYAAFKRGLDYAGQQYKAMFKKAGVKNVNITTVPLRDPAKPGGGIDINLKR